MKTVLPSTLAMILGGSVLVYANEFSPGDRVEGAHHFFMCGAREDLYSIRALERTGDKQTALKVGTERCETAVPRNSYVVSRVEGEAVCIGRDADVLCLWALRSSLQPTPSQ